MDAVNALIANPALHDYLAVLKGARNGLVYGVKIRFPHALVMTILFGRGDWKTRLQQVLRLTKIHSVNLALYVALYKTIMLMQKKARGGKVEQIHPFIAGTLAGFYIFGLDRSSVNEQVVLYITARLVAALFPRASPPKPGSPSYDRFALLASASWGIVMWLFQEYPDRVQSGMRNSMVYLYKDSEHFTDLRSLFWHNK